MLLYNLAISAYSTAARIYALFNGKARQMVRGQQECFDALRRGIDPSRRYIWFHVASLGEFEQGRPLMERIRTEHPEYGILLTFFSPSGYEVRKNYDGADVVCYLPFDTPGNVRRFLDAARPCMAFFVKYEFWKNYLDALHERQIPVYSVSSIFREGQLFFRSYGGFYRRVLKNFSHLFVQNEHSRELLHGIGVDCVTVAGDTRFDRVLQIREQAKELPLIESFRNGRPTFVAGSSWQPDEDLFIEYFNKRSDIRLIIAPHVIDESHLREIEGKLKGKNVVRYTRATEQDVAHCDCLLIDCFGLLSSIYRYGDIAYIGGGFGAGIHNTVEAAVYGIPVLFGPKWEKFDEARQLLKERGAFCVSNAEQLATVLDKLLGNTNYLFQCGQNAGNYVHGSAGATEIILRSVKF